MLKRRSLNKLSLLVIVLSTITIFLITPKKNIKAAIIPHHLVASSFIEDLGSRLSKNKKISEVIIIGPNHYEIGDIHLNSSDDITSQDHSCYGPQKVLQKYLPKTKISCILVSSRSTLPELLSMAKKLESQLGVNGVLVASIDFSHYQTYSTASQNDITTQKYIDNYDKNNLLPLGNSFLDSPRTAILLFDYLNLISITNFTQVNHSNSALILNDLTIPSTTSYFEYIYF